jgi:hypothetical protein
MTINEARRFIITASLIATGATFVFFLVAPAVGYPLTWVDVPRVFEIILPVFLGYLGSATHFLFRARQDTKDIQLRDPGGMFGLLIRGPLAVFGVGIIALLFAFGYVNRIGAPNGSGMGVDELSHSLTALVGLLAVTTNAAVGYLFSLGGRASARGAHVDYLSSSRS